MKSITKTASPWCLDFVPASTGRMEPELARKTLESQFRVSLLTANDAFFIIEDLWVILMNLDVLDLAKSQERTLESCLSVSLSENTNLNTV
ncbi:hypothetical protein AVEN_151826-1 [Araneus ventricosus]|uniref:Uncharacterized protein n=1 Tax=Araneus ventricosus TaxID=182803 RepID=A0A4Y2MQN6_ARAVE|nr:hypothetical protein AVEN_151826-1 [Araneus ventricosus]